MPWITVAFFNILIVSVTIFYYLKAGWIRNDAVSPIIGEHDPYYRVYGRELRHLRIMALIMSVVMLVAVLTSITIIRILMASSVLKYTPHSSYWYSHPFPFVWKSDPTFKALSEQNKQNCKGEKSGRGHSKHIGGPKPAEWHYRQLALELGRRPTAREMYDRLGARKSIVKEIVHEALQGQNVVSDYIPSPPAAPTTDGALPTSNVAGVTSTSTRGIDLDLDLELNQS